jgi:starch phosphorylase
MKLPEIKNPVAYFCSEFAIDNDLPTYSGGLGILAADLLNSAATKHFPMVGIGILYNGREFIQHITGDGREEKRDSEFDHDSSFLRPTTINGKPLILSLPSPSGEIKVKSYHLRLSDTVVIFFLSTNVDGNPPDWITDMDALYHGDTNSKIRQQILLGVGGIKLLHELNITPYIYHINEGRPGFIIWEIANEIKNTEKVSYEEAWKRAKEKIVYTNHTLVPAGNLTYPLSTVKWWAEPFTTDYQTDSNTLVKDGMTDNQNFSITQFALNISSKHSAVSKIHEEYCKREYPGYNWLSITNGVHMERWQDSDFRNEKLSDREIWDMHMTKKKELMETVVKRTGYGYDYERLVVTWARRLAEYKQPKAIFEDIERLKKILASSERPIQLLFAGNSHSADPHAKSIIEEIIKIFSNDLSGHAIFIPNYNISLSNHLTSGSDIWLNTPKGNLEACGTSGMKAISNGVLNCTVLDGWTYEVDWQGIGWVLDPNHIANNFYDYLENEITPLFYKRNENGLPIEWIERMKKSIDLAKKFSSDRMFEEYKEKLYQDLPK